MGPSGVVEAEVAADRGSGIGHGIIGAQVDLLVFDRPPEPLDEDVVTPGALAVHADRDTRVEEHAGEGGAGELAALIRVEDLGLAMVGESFFQGLGVFRRANLTPEPGDRRPKLTP